MMRIRHVLLLLVLCGIHTNINSQSNLAFGAWESHLPYQRGLAVTQSPSKIYYATDFSIMSIEKEDLSLDFISKTEGLTELGISDIKYDPYSENLMIIYENSDIDILTEDGIVNIADIKNNLGIIGDKRINGVHFTEDKTAYLSTGFGIVSLNMDNFQFGFTTQMGLQAYGSTTLDNTLYAATEDGLYALDLNENFNFGDFSNWRLNETEVGLPLIYQANGIANFNGNLYLWLGNTVLVNSNGQYEPLYTPSSGENIAFLNPDGSELMIGTRKESQFSSTIQYVDSDNKLTEGTSSCGNFINYAVSEASGRIWYADDWNNFRYTDDKTGSCQRFTAPSPYSHTSSDLKIRNGALYVASGGVSEGFNFGSNRNGVYVLEDRQWTNLNSSNTDFFGANEFINSFVIEPDPNSDNVYIGSFFSGLAKANLKTGAYELYNSENSPILGSAAIPEIEKVSGLALDQNKNLWISLYEADKPLVVLSADNTFHSYNVPASNRIGSILVDDYNYKWIQVTGPSGGILIFDDNGTVNDPSDGKAPRFLNTSNSNLKTNTINCFALDLDGNVWVGTANGPIIFECGSDPFNTDNCIGSIPRVLEDSIAAELLVTEDVRSIAIDGANRKWIGSRNGIFVQSAGGREKVARFTIDNSPLFDNNIIDMAYDGSSGIMYIATDKGIQAYKTETTIGDRRHKNTTYAFPNPVRPDYDGLIAIRGLARDATIKITDINGQLVHESEALGGQAVWDGRDYSGRKVSTGVYLVFSNSRSLLDDPDTAVTKVLIVR